MSELKLRPPKAKMARLTRRYKRRTRSKPSRWAQPRLLGAGMLCPYVQVMVMERIWLLLLC